MRLDPRHLNETFDASGASSYLRSYAANLQASIDAVDEDMVTRAAALILDTAARGNRIFAIGNGGSAAIVEHLVCDLVKGTHIAGQHTLDVTSLASNMALYSAVANDFGFEHVFAAQIEYFGRPGDLVLAVSSSGTSRNIVHAVKTASALGLQTIGFTGFDGGEVRDLADMCIHVPCNNFGIVEDAHQAVFHALAQYLTIVREDSDSVPSVVESRR